jgi:hypothetical protein
MKNKTALFIISMITGYTLFSQVNLDANGHPTDKAHAVDLSKLSTNNQVYTAKAPVVIKQIKGPSTALDDIAFDGTNLWVEGYCTNLLYKVSPVTGATLKTIPTSICKTYGLEFANGNLWVADNGNHIIQQVDTANGNVITSFSSASECSTSYPTGLAWDGQNLWQNDPNSGTTTAYDTTYKTTATGQLIQSYFGIGTYITGLAWDGKFLWLSDNGSVVLYKIDVSTFTIIDIVSAPGGKYPNGLAYDGQHLWVSNNASDSIYQLDISNTATGITNHVLTNAADIVLYPNPAQGEITITLPVDKAGASYTIIDLTGKQITTGNLPKQTNKIDISQLALGMYFLQVGGFTRQSFKVIKN